MPEWIGAWTSRKQHQCQSWPHVLDLVTSHSWHVCVIIELISAYFNFWLCSSDSLCSLYLSSTFSHYFRVLLYLCPSSAWLVVFIHIVAGLFTFVYLKHTYILEPSTPFLGYSLWTPVLAARSSLSRPIKWLVCFYSFKSLSDMAHIQLDSSD